MTGFQLHLMRHGAPETPGLLLGRTDAPITPAGVSACMAKAAALPFAAVIASDLQRAARPASAIADARGLPVTIDARWREVDFGAWDGLAPHQVPADAMAAFWNDPDANPPPDGERWSALVARVMAALCALPPRDTLVITHGGAIRAVMAGLLGFEQRHIWAFDLPYAAVVSLRLWPGSPPAAQIIGLC